MPTKMNFIMPNSEDEVIISNNIVTINGTEYNMGANDILLVLDESGSSVDLSNYVTLDGDQTISGNKTFSSNVQFGSQDIDATTPPVIVNSTYGYIALGEVDLDSYATKLTFSERGSNVDYFGRYIKYPSTNFTLNLPEPQSDQTHTLATQEWVQSQGSNGGTKYYRHNFVLFVPADTDYGTEEATYTFGAILSHSEPIVDGASFKNFLPKIMTYDQNGDAYFTEGIGITSNGGYAGIFYFSVYGDDTFDTYIRMLDSGEVSAHSSFSSISITDNVVEL